MKSWEPGGKEEEKRKEEMCWCNTHSISDVSTRSSAYGGCISKMQSRMLAEEKSVVKLGVGPMSYGNPYTDEWIINEY